jgi:pyruvate dehydrogenase E2 component (dihydrolipoamide acetyltransferase)
VPELLRMPSVSAGSDGATLASWNVDENQLFSADDVIATIETAKAAVDIQAPRAGRLVRILVSAGAEIATGDAIAVLVGGDETVDDVPAALQALGLGRAEQPLAEEEQGPQPDADSQPQEGGVSARLPDLTVPRVFASPLARRIARDNGLAYESIEGTGPHGRIMRADVMRAIAQRDDAGRLTGRAAQPERMLTPEHPPVPATAAAADNTDTLTDSSGGQLIPLTRIRRAIARRVTESKSTVPHFYVRGTARVDALLALRQELNTATGVKVTVNDFILKAVAAAYAEVPEAAVIWGGNGLRRFETIDLGVAIAAPGGLVTPVMHDVQRLSISTIAARTRALAKLASEGQLRPDDLEGGIATVSNLGMFGTEEFSAIINPPQSAILAVGAARDEVAVIDGAVGVAKILRVTLSADHRAIDGALAAEWMRAFLGVIASPIRILS